MHVQMNDGKLGRQFIDIADVVVLGTGEKIGMSDVQAHAHMAGVHIQSVEAAEGRIKIGGAGQRGVFDAEAHAALG